MKNKFKFLIASVSIAMLFLSSCEKEMYDDAIYQSQKPQNLSISKINFKELKSNKNAVEKIKHVMSKKLPTSIANRAVYNEDFGVLIDTTNIVQMTSATKQTVTFNIINYVNSSKKENLVLVSNNDGNFEAYIAEYNLTPQDLSILANGGSLQNIQPSSISEIESTSKIAVSSSCISISTYTVGMCSDANGNSYENIGNNGNDLIREIRALYDNYGYTTKILAASIRHSAHVREVGLIGADVATMPLNVIKALYKHPLTDKGIEIFLADHKKANTK